MVDPVSGCWNWPGAKDKEGYGMWRKDGRSLRVHRLLYERRHGPIPAGLEPHHVCENKGCCNPDHIRPVTHAENIRASRMSKLDWDKVALIRASTEKQRVLAERFGVSGANISNIQRGKMWREETRA